MAVHENTVRKWIADGAIKATKIGKVIRVSDEEVERLKRGEQDMEETKLGNIYTVFVGNDSDEIDNSWFMNAQAFTFKRFMFASSFMDTCIHNDNKFVVLQIEKNVRIEK